MGIQTKKGQKGRIDHCLVSSNLMKHTKSINHTSIGEHLTDHRAIEIVIDWAKAKRGKGNFHAKKEIEKKIIYFNTLLITSQESISEVKWTLYQN